VDLGSPSSVDPAPIWLTGAERRFCGAGDPIASQIRASVRGPLGLTPREIELPRVSRKATVVIGVRRAGKTFL
jgi:hypothetical protein